MKRYLIIATLLVISVSSFASPTFILKKDLILTRSGEDLHTKIEVPFGKLGLEKEDCFGRADIFLSRTGGNTGDIKTIKIPKGTRIINAKGSNKDVELCAGCTGRDAGKMVVQTTFTGEFDGVDESWIFFKCQAPGFVPVLNRTPTLKKMINSLLSDIITQE